MATSLYYCTCSLPDSMHAGYTYPDTTGFTDAIVCLLPVIIDVSLQELDLVL